MYSRILHNIVAPKYPRVLLCLLLLQGDEFGARVHCRHSMSQLPEQSSSTLPYIQSLIVLLRAHTHTS
jgi:hypothetical protein